MIITLPKDIENTSIPHAISGISDVQVIEYTANWVGITTCTDIKDIMIQPRSVITWYFSTTSGGEYFTLRDGSALQFDLVCVSGTTIGWITADSPATFEVLTGR